MTIPTLFDPTLGAARSGDRRALDHLLRRHATSIRRVCQRVGRDLGDVDDLYQDTLLAVARNIGQFRGDAAFMTWVFTIARSCANRMRARLRRVPTSFEMIEARFGDEAADPDDELSTGELRRAIAVALEELSPLDREVLTMRDIGGYSAVEVARALGLTVSAVKSRLHRARYCIRAALAQAQSDGTLPDDHHVVRRPARARFEPDAGL